VQQARDFRISIVLNLNLAFFSTISRSIAILSFLLIGSSLASSNSSDDLIFTGLDASSSVE
jgi:hypothetical protein